MYTFNSRVRYSEVDNREKLTLESLLDYFQDCSTFQAEDLEIGIDYLAQFNLAWVLNMWQIDVHRFPKLGEIITIGTNPYDLKSFLGYRNFAMYDEQGGLLASANTLWTMLNLKTGRPERVPEKVAEAYRTEPKLEMEYLPRKIVLPPNGEEKPAITVSRSNLDSNQHVNNGQYVRMAEEFLPQEFQVKRLRVEYKEQAFLNDELTPLFYSLENGYAVSLNNAEKRPCAVVAFYEVPVKG